MRRATANRLPCTTPEGHPLLYELEGLGTLDVHATSRPMVADRPGEIIDLSEEILWRQKGQDRAFWWHEQLFDIFVGNFVSNHNRRNWAGSDLGGGTQIYPGGIGDITVPCTDRVDCISKKHDLQF
jgi:hypothetical protein